MVDKDSTFMGLIVAVIWRSDNDIRIIIVVDIPSGPYG